MQTEPQKIKKGLVLLSNEMVAVREEHLPFSMSDVSDFMLPLLVFYNSETRVLAYDNLFDLTYLMYDAH